MKRLSYSDAALMLGGTNTFVERLSKAAGAVLTAASAGTSEALGWFDLKSEAERLTQDTVANLQHRVHGLTRFHRSQLLEAAHATIVVSSFFKALDQMKEKATPILDSATMQLSRTDQANIATGEASRTSGLGKLASQLTKPGAIPGLGNWWLSRDSGLRPFYVEMAAGVVDFAAGTAAWDTLDETQRHRWATDVGGVPPLAVTVYTEQLQQLAGQFPEFAFWAHRLGVETILDGIVATQASLRQIAELIEPIAFDRHVSEARANLVKEYKNQLDRPIAGIESNLSDGITLPTVRRIYINPAYRVWTATGSDSAFLDSAAWEETSARDDLWSFVISHLLSTSATRAPTVVLGQPGAGKSVFTQVLAEGLDPGEYSVIRVELRSVPWDAQIQQMIEAAIESTTGSAVSWPDFVRDNGEQAQPVVILDGFDELLQASGVENYNFLEKIRQFQEREATMRQPAAVFVTSRTAVADQVRYPFDTTIVSLEDFDDVKVEQWLDVWNSYNAAHPLSANVALRRQDLARQPLLLFMLAMFHSQGGGLTSDIDQAQLYERLFVLFAKRDVGKHLPSSSMQARDAAVRRSLNELSMVAFAMYNRNSQAITEDALLDDFLALGMAQDAGTGTTKRLMAVSLTQRIAGTFFFRLLTQRAQATVGPSIRSSYEFLHASFGEFLVARWIVNELNQLVLYARAAVCDPNRKVFDDAQLLRTLLSFNILCTREQRVLLFVIGILWHQEEQQLSEMRDLLTELSTDLLWRQPPAAYLGYRPSPSTFTRMYACSSVNIALLLLVLAHSRGDDGVVLSIADLCGTGEATSYAEGDTVDSGQSASVVRLWHSQLTGAEWRSVLGVLDLRDFPRVGPWEPGIVFGSPFSQAQHEASAMANTRYMRAIALLAPLRDSLADGVPVDLSRIDMLDTSVVEVFDLLLETDWEPERRVKQYQSALAKLHRAGDLSVREARMIMRQAAFDSLYLGNEEVARLLDAMSRVSWINSLATFRVASRFYSTLPAGVARPSTDALVHVKAPAAVLPIHEGLAYVTQAVARSRRVSDHHAIVESVHALSPISDDQLCFLFVLRDLLPETEFDALRQHLIGELVNKRAAPSRGWSPTIIDFAYPVGSWLAVIESGCPAPPLPISAMRYDMGEIEGVLEPLVQRFLKMRAHLGV